MAAPYHRKHKRVTPDRVLARECVQKEKVDMFSRR
jgi:hypothetical protein